MSAGPSFPGWPWQRVVPFVVLAVSLWAGIRWQRRSLDPVRAFYLPSYLSMSLPCPHFHTQTLLLEPGGTVATPQTRAARLYPVVQPIAGRDVYLAWLRVHVFDGQSITRVLLPTELPALLLFLLAGMAAQQSLRNSQAEASGGRLLQGAPLLSHWRWNRPLWFRRKERGWYIPTK